MTTTTSNIIDLAEYRRKLAQTQAPDQELDQDCPLDWVPEASPLPPHPRYSALLRRRGLALDHLASIGMLLMTLAFTLRSLIF